MGGDSGVGVAGGWIKLLVACVSGVVGTSVSLVVLTRSVATVSQVDKIVHVATSEFQAEAKGKHDQLQASIASIRSDLGAKVADRFTQADFDRFLEQTYRPEVERLDRRDSESSARVDRLMESFYVISSGRGK